MEKTEFTFKFEGVDELDVNLVVESLQNISNSLKEINKNENGEPITVNVKPFKKGSYDIIFSFFSDASIATSAGMLYNQIPGDTIIEKFQSIVELVPILQGKKKEEGKSIGNNNYEFKNDAGEVTIVEGNKIDNYYQNVGVVINVEKLYIGASENANVDGFKLLDKNQQIITAISKEVIKAASKQIQREIGVMESPEVKSRVITKYKAIISIIKPDLAGETLWKVEYEGNVINVKIEDEEFRKKVNKKEYSFVNGTPLVVDLAITQLFDDKLLIFKNKSYTVIKFHSILPQAEQQDMFKEN